MEVGHITHSPASGQPLYSTITKTRRKTALPSDAVAATRNDGDGNDTFLNLYSGDPKRWSLATNSSWGEHHNVSNGKGMPTSNSASDSSSSPYHNKTSMDPHHHHESAADVHRVLYQDLAEIMPLLESFMDQHNNKPFTRHNAALTYTPSPPTKKGQMLFKEAKDRAHMLDGCKSSMTASKDSEFWDNAEDSGNVYSNVKTGSRSSSLVSPTSDGHRTSSRKKASTVADLQNRIQELEQKVKDKEEQLQSLENAREADILCLQTRIDEMQIQAVEREKDLHVNMSALKDSQDEIVKLHSLLERAEVEVQVSKASMEKVQGELHSLQRNVASFLVRMQNISSSQLENDHILDQVEIRSDKSMQTKENGQTHNSDIDASMDLMREKYVACLIAARENPNEDLLLLASQLRGQLQSCLMKTTIPLMQPFSQPFMPSY